eukprot:NODE_809_length_1765_cov_76.103730_g663_i0.p1 GENE.NODE_809_length_1765_cov_76.103730_g663_i0~~NODE_809_length_1765_cov_76.103730_g663_i0.p1  ORF type:complete len:548 (+),score=190.30 NODE_809_length_1765_cov_76.103730_g663_i0:79-1722(+)
MFRLCALLLVAAASAESVRLRGAPRLADGWVDTQVAVPADQSVQVKIALVQPADAIAALSADVLAGQQFTRREVIARTLPTQQSRSAVQAWLKAAGLQFTTSPSGQGFEVVATFKQVSELFQTSFTIVKNNVTGRSWHRAADLHIPADLMAHVGAVYGLHGLPLPPRKTPQTTKPAADFTVTPATIHKRYGVTVTRGSGNVKVRQAVAEFQGQFSNPTDLATFFKQYVPNAQAGDDKVYAYQGNKENGWGVEALLDIQYIMGVAPGVKTEFWGYANTDFCSDLKTWTDALMADDDVPLVHSISYGYQGEPSGVGCTAAELKDVDQAFMKLAARGISIIFASGDSGSGESLVYLYPSWPASSPWVTAVGATAFTDSSMSEEEASTQFGSGSGFSWDFDIPAFQAPAVTAYKRIASSSLPPSFMWAQKGRGSADVSSLGENYQVVVNGATNNVGGTSASTPAFAGMISLINDQLVSKGKKPLGFLNTLLYKNPSAFNDITKGSDKVSRAGTPLLEGFECAQGWDPATGLGTPKWADLLKAAMGGNSTVH